MQKVVTMHPSISVEEGKVDIDKLVPSLVMIFPMIGGVAIVAFVEILQVSKREKFFLIPIGIVTSLGATALFVLNLFGILEL